MSLCIFDLVEPVGVSKTEQLVAEFETLRTMNPNEPTNEKARRLLSRLVGSVFKRSEVMNSFRLVDLLPSVATETSPERLNAFDKVMKELECRDYTKIERISRAIPHKPEDLEVYACYRILVYLYDYMIEGLDDIETDRMERNVFYSLPN